MGTQQTWKQDWFHHCHSTIFLVLLQEILPLLGKSWLGLCFQLSEHGASQGPLKMKSMVWSDQLLSASSSPSPALHSNVSKISRENASSLSHSKPFQTQGISLNLLIQNNQWMRGLHAFINSSPGGGWKPRDFLKLEYWNHIVSGTAFKRGKKYSMINSHEFSLMWSNWEGKTLWWAGTGVLFNNCCLSRNSPIEEETTQSRDFKKKMAVCPWRRLVQLQYGKGVHLLGLVLLTHRARSALLALSLWPWEHLKTTRNPSFTSSCRFYICIATGTSSLPPWC